MLTTARDIIFLWIARMIFSGLELIGDGPVPRRGHPLVPANPDGSGWGARTGTGIEPEDALEPYGADATRYGLLKVTSSQDPRFSFGTIEEGRKLANKLWNASRLLLLAGAAEPEARPSSVEERWILARIDATRAELEADLAGFDFAHAVQRLYHLTFDDFCDWYLESIKPRLEEEDVRATAFAALERLLKLLHPVMPHVTEEIWTNLPARETRLIVAPWPEPQTEYAADLHALDEAQTAARLYRRSGVRIEIGGDSLRIFEAVVRPARATGRATSRPSARGCARRSSAASGCSRTRSSSPTPRRRSSRASGRSSSNTVPSSTRWVESLSPWPEDGFGTERMRALLRELGDPQERFPAIHVVGTNGKSTTTRLTEALLLDAGALGRLVLLPPRARLERADPGRAARRRTSRRR